MAREADNLPILNLHRRRLPLKRRHALRGSGLPGPTSGAHAVSRLHWAFRYAVAVAASAACAGLHLLFEDRVSRTPLLIYMPAILSAGIYGGAGPGLLATALGGGAAVSILAPHPSWANLRSAGLADPVAIFLTVGAMISYISHLLHRAVGSLRGNERSFQSVVEGVTDYAILMLDASGRVASWNKGAQRIKGYLPGEILGEHFSRFFPPEEAGAGLPNRLLEDAARMGSVHDEGWRRRKDGTRFWASVVITVHKDENGDLIGYTIITRDLTERKLAEDAARKRSEIALHESEAKHKSLFDAIDEGFCLIELIFDERKRAVDYRFLEVNHAFASQTGLTNAAGRTMRELAPEHEEQWFEAYGRIALTGVPARFQGPAGKLGNRWYDVYAWRYGEPERRQVAVLFNDITERKKHAELLERAVAERTADLEAFAYTVSHDLRAPLRAIQGYAYLALQRLRGRADEESVGLLQRMECSAARMDRLIRDVLVFTQPGRERPELTDVDLDTLVDHIVENYDRARATVIVDRPLGTVRGQETLLTQAISNLVDNAVKFVPEGRAPEVRVRAERREPGKLRVVVEDNGIGIPPEHQARIFAPFVRVAPGEYGGTGIGLAIVKKAAESAGGAAGVESVPGKGSSFWIELTEGSHAP